MKDTAVWTRNLRRRAQSLAAAVTCTVLLAGVAQAQAVSSRETGSLSGGRDGHRAFRLADGRVLVFAGLNEARRPAINSEIYDPASGQWSASGDMNVPRAASSAAMLSDGRILVVGGQPLEGDPRVADIYDPSTGTWTVSGRMKRQRYLPTATLLGDGRVIVAGGELNHKTKQTYEIYDPSAGTFSAPRRMPKPFLRHSATRLPDGRVLFAGGLVKGGSGAEAYLYDTTSDMWVATGSRHETAGDHTAVLLPTTGEVLAFKGTVAELYDPSTGEWRRTGDLPTDLAGFAAAVTTDGRVLVISGNEHPPGGTLTAKILVYSPATGTWSDDGSLLQGRYLATATLLLDGGVLVAGGRTTTFPDFVVFNTAEIYTP